MLGQHPDGANWQAISAIDDVKGSGGRAIHWWDANCLGWIAWEKGPARHLAAVTAFEARGKDRK